MTALDPDALQYTQTSPGGAIYRSNLATAIAAIVVAAAPLESGTASTYEFPLFLERTAAGPAGQLMPVPLESTGEAVPGNPPAIRLDMGGTRRPVRCFAPECSPLGQRQACLR